MLLENQLNAIRQQVSSGGPLPQDMASALLAAYETAEQNRKNNLAQIDRSRARFRKLAPGSHGRDTRATDHERPIVDCRRRDRPSRW